MRALQKHDLSNDTSMHTIDRNHNIIESLVQKNFRGS